MNIEQAAQIATQAITTAKKGIMGNGIADPKFIYGVCNKLATMLDIPIETVLEIMDAV